MRIKKLELKNFRGFEELVIEFPEGEAGLAVFVGVNGSGKTSVLRALSNLLINFTNDLLEENWRLPFSEMLSRQDVKRGIAYRQECVITGKLKIIGNEDFVIENNTRDGGSYSSGGEYINYLKEQYKRVRTKFGEENWGNIPVLCFYASSRIVTDNPSLKAKDISGFKPFDIWKDAFEKTVDFDELFEWFRNTEDVENQKRLREDNSFRYKGLELIRQIIPIFLDDFSNPYVNREGGEELLVKKGDEELSISNLSEGERMVFAMVADISRRLTIANPNLVNPLEGYGIVLIDEIEQHLHPAWQRTIIPNLRRTFPNIQFILTTHSPQVLSNVNRENVFILNNFKLESMKPHTKWRDTNAILEDVFDVSKRPPKGEQAIHELYQAIEKKDVPEAKRKLTELKKVLGDRDLELQRAETYMELLMD